MSSTVYYFSGAEHSKAVAEFFAKELGTQACDITEKVFCNADTAVVVFPVYCQNIPVPVKNAIKSLNAQKIAFAAVYGKISAGNTLYEAKALTNKKVIAAAYVPSGHTYLNEACDFDRAALFPFINKIKNGGEEVTIPFKRKDFLADVFPALRSRMAVKIKRTSDCTGCNACRYACPFGAIKNGRAGFACIRCLKCVKVCPYSALEVSYSSVLMHYLKRKKHSAKPEIFL